MKDNILWVDVDDRLVRIEVKNIMSCNISVTHCDPTKPSLVYRLFGVEPQPAHTKYTAVLSLSNNSTICLAGKAAEDLYKQMKMLKQEEMAPTVEEMAKIILERGRS